VTSEWTVEQKIKEVKNDLYVSGITDNMWSYFMGNFKKHMPYN